jgi:hypothetical protein
MCAVEYQHGQAHLARMIEPLTDEAFIQELTDADLVAAYQRSELPGSAGGLGL